MRKGANALICFQVLRSSIQSMVMPSLPSHKSYSGAARRSTSEVDEGRRLPCPFYSRIYKPLTFPLPEPLKMSVKWNHWRPHLRTSGAVFERRSFFYHRIHKTYSGKASSLLCFKPEFQCKRWGKSSFHIGRIWKFLIYDMI
jgi:hypothetical protein